MPYALHHLLDQSADASPDFEAIVDRERRITFAALSSWSRRFAGHLLAAGLQRRDRVGIYLEKSIEEAAAVFGVPMADGVLVPINPLMKPQQVAHILRDCHVRWLLTTAARWQALRDALGDLPTLEHVFLVDAADSDGPNHTSSVFDTAVECDPPGHVVGEDLAAILYTSGSTGRPKGVMLSHRNLLAGSRIVSQYLGLTPADRILSVLPFSFDYGLNQLITAAEKRAAVVLLTFRFGDAIVRTIAKERCTGLAGVPSIWAVLAQGAPSLHTTTLDSLRYLTNSGGAVPTDTLRRIRQALPHVKFYLMYGLTEAFRSTYLPPEEIDQRPTSIGRAIPESEVFLVNEEGKPCGPGEEGVLVHRGPTVSLGYWNRPEDTAAVLRRNPLIGEHEGADIVCYSGDLARMDEDGYFYFVGRRDAMIKSAGYRISPTEVEEVLMTPGVLAQVAVIGLPDATLGERVHAVAVSAPGRKASKDVLLAHASRELPGPLVPRDIEFVAELPRSANGKVDYQRLKAERCEKP